MDENALLGIINALKNQIVEIKENMREQQKKEIEDLEAAYEQEKSLLVQKCQEDIDGYKDVISLQKGELERLEHDNEDKDEKIENLQTNITDKEDEFQQKLQECNTKINDYDFLQDRFDKKIEEIEKLNEKLIKKKEKYKRYKDEESIPLYDKKKYDKVEIGSNEMSNDQKEFAIETTKKSFNMYDSHFERAKYISNQFESKYGGNWCTILSTRGYGSYYFIYFDKCYISFTFGEFNVSIGKTQKKDILNLYDKGNYDKVDFLSNEMSDDQKNFAINTTRRSLKTHDSHFECAKYISNQFESEYGGSWCTILSTRGYGDSYFTYRDKCYISFTMGEFVVNIAKTQRKDILTLHDKGDYDKVDILSNEMSYNQKNFAIETTRKGLNMYDDHSKCARYISNQFNSKYGGSWCAILSTRGYGSFCFSYCDDCYILFTMGEFNVSIAKNQRKDTITLYDKGNYYNVDIQENKMNNYQKDFAIETTRNGLKRYDDHFDCAQYIKNQFQSKYSGKWCVNLRPRGYGSCCCTFYDSCYISFIMAEFVVIIFKSSKS